MRVGRNPRLRQLLGRLFALSGAIVIAAAIAAALSMVHLTDERQAVVNRIDPSVQAADLLLAGYLDEETGVRGYVLTGQALFLHPYQSGRSTVQAADRDLGGLLPAADPAARLLGAVRQRAAAWEGNFAAPAVAAVARGDRSFASDAELTRGKDLFDSLRSSIAALQSRLAAERVTANDRLSQSENQLMTVMGVSLLVILVNWLVIWIALRRLVIDPLADVAADARTVTGGELPVRAAGPKEIADLAADIDAMRMKIFAEIVEARDAREQLAAMNADLARSNEDLEQFAYVASHDLQEPLRKVTSFCQLLEQRYSGQLDERGEKYIAFAVDGAKRMQILINDLLAFSRIGRSTEAFVPVALGECLEQALRNLSDVVEDTGATVSVDGDLPTVPGDRSLLTALLQNLVGNAIKFRSDAPPEVRIGASPAGDDWLVSVTDNGIGIEPRFAERIFVIFQRLHGREAYSGTGIGLAMCRKIVEFHGGRIWLDVDHHPGTRFCMTLSQSPAQKESNESNELDPAAVRPG